MGRSYEHAEFNEAFALAHETSREEDHVFTFARASGEHEWSLVAHVDGAVELCASVIVGGAYTHVEFGEVIANRGVVSFYANLYGSCNGIGTHACVFSEVDFNVSPLCGTCRARLDAGNWK